VCLRLGKELLIGRARLRGIHAPLTRPGGQPHCELVASVKFFTDVCTLDASLVTAATAAAEGFDGSAATEFFSALTDELMALVWLGKSLLAELTSAVAVLGSFALAISRH
jgi:hypothetical protein